MKTKIFIFVAFCVYVSDSYLRIVEADQKPDLYSPADDVIRLNSTTFIPTVFHQNKNMTYMVQFYNTFCGHCQMFAPVYKDLASRVKNWSSVIRVAGIDCSKDENVDTCSDNKIDGYPTILIFPPNARVQDPNDKPLNLRSLNIEWTVDDIEESMIDYIANLSTTNRQFPPVVEALKPIIVTDKDDLQRIYTAKDEPDANSHHIQDLMIVVESEKSYLGSKLIVEFYRIHSRLELRRVLLSNKPFLKSLLPVDEFNKLEDNEPILVRFNDHEAQVLVRGEHKHVLSKIDEHEREDFIHERFRVFFEHFYSVELDEKSVENEPTHNVRKLRPPIGYNNEIPSKNNEELEIQYLLDSESISGKRIFAIDLLKGISYMLNHEVKIKGDLDSFEYNTLRNLLTILKKYLPLEKWDSSFNRFIMELRTHLDKNRVDYEKNGITSQEMKELLELSGADTIRLRYNRENYVSCMISDRQHKGYTCSLWLLFHSLTVGEYYKAAPVRIRPTLVLFTMRDYITKFLGCTVCSSNFAKETESLENSLINRNSSVIWLWRTHNLVNQRLNNERQSSKRPLAQVIFPSDQYCPDCYLSDPEAVGLDGKTFEDMLWNRTNLLNYLIDLYKPNGIVSPKEMTILLAKVRGKVNYDLIDSSTRTDIYAAMRTSIAGADMNQSEKWNIHSIFSTSDISLCLILYLACIVMVAIVCVALNPKWKRFKTK